MHAIPRIAWGDTLQPLRFRVLNTEGEQYGGAPLELASATLQIFSVDAEGVVALLPSFATPVDCEIVDGPTDSEEDVDTIAQWRPAYGSGAGEIPAITDVTQYEVLVVATDADGHEWSIRSTWSLRPR